MRTTLLGKCAAIVLIATGVFGCGGVTTGGGSTNPPQPSQSPSISSFSPTSGAEGTAVTVTGTNLSNVTGLTFNGTTASFTVVSATQITTSVPTGASTGKIHVASGAGSADSSGSFTVNSSKPTISGFSPTSGQSGTSVTITGSNFTGANAVAFQGVAATFTVTDDTHIAATVPAGATTGQISVRNAQGTTYSSTNFVVNQPAPTISSFSPTSGPTGTSVTITGTNFTGTTSVKFNGTAATFSVSDSSHIATSVPTGATTGTVTVTTPSGTATSASTFSVGASASLDLSIDGFYVTQATQNYPAHDVPLVSGRSAWVRVFVVANQSNTAKPQVRVQFIKGSTTNTLTINAPGNSVPTIADVTNVASSWNAAVPAAWIQSGTQVVVTVDPSNAISESNKGNNQATQTPTVQTTHQWKITLIPVKTGDGKIGTVETGSRTKADLVEVARRLYPMPDGVDVTVGAQMTSSVNSLASDGTGWNTVLSELLAKRTADGASVSDRYYFGFVKVGYNSGVAGLGYVGAPAAIGWDYNGAEWVLAHEEGHNFNRPHSPCGGAANPDPNYPYAGGVIGVPGWDAFATSSNLKPATDTDIMGYCSNQWISDYVYKSVLNFRASNSFDIAQAAVAANPSAPKEGLLVWGHIEGGRMVLEPAFRVTNNGAAIEAGPYTWEGKDAQGRVIASVPFKALEVEDLPNRTEQQFAFIVPLEASALDALSSVNVRKGQTTIASQFASAAAKAQSAMNMLRVQPLPNRGLEIHWDALANPVVMLRDAQTGEVRGFLRGGDAQIEDAPNEVELKFSDGVRTTTFQQTRQQP